MGANAPEQKASGSGTTIQRSFIPEDISRDSQNAFKSTLQNTLNTASPSLPSFGKIGSYNPTALDLQKNVNLQSRADTYNFGNLFSNELDPVVSGQLSRGLQDSAMAANQRNQNISQQFGMGNEALVRSLQSENNINNALNEGQARLSALGQQREYDVARRGAEERAASIDMQRMEQLNNAQLASGNFANQALLSQRQADDNAYRMNMEAINFNNQTDLNAYNSQLQGNMQQQELLKILGQGLITTAPQGQMNFTVDDLAKLKNNPALLDPYIYGGGLLTQNEMNMFQGGGGQQNLVKYAQAPQQSQWYEQGRGWTRGDGMYQNSAYAGVNRADGLGRRYN